MYKTTYTVRGKLNGFLKTLWSKQRMVLPALEKLSVGCEYYFLSQAVIVI